MALDGHFWFVFSRRSAILELDGIALLLEHARSGGLLMTLRVDETANKTEKDWPFDVAS